jgi:hypothetical protein
VNRVRRAKNEALFREVNERIRELSLMNAAPAEYLCECGRPECMTAFPVPPDAYRAVRSHERRFLVRPEHVDPEIEVVVEQTEQYAVVEKIGEAAEIVEAHSDRPESDD